ncbi:MAG: hypothetical protein ACI9LM_004867 [Alteromonadaceae bacterium]|jgi:hypothetical protein
MIRKHFHFIIALFSQHSKIVRILNSYIILVCKGLMNEVLEGHIREYLGAEDIISQQRQEEVEQVISVLKSDLK